MTLDQLNELINRGYVGMGLLAIAFALLLIYAKINPEKVSRKK